MPPQAREALAGIIDRATERWTLKAEAHRERARAKAALAPDLLAFDDSPEGERLRRYELACGRAMSRSLDKMLKLRSAPDPVERTIESRRTTGIDMDQQIPATTELNVTNEPTEEQDRRKKTEERSDNTENMTNEPTEVGENVTNEPTNVQENTTNEPTAVWENTTNEPTNVQENTTNEPTAVCENTTNEPTVAADPWDSECMERSATTSDAGVAYLETEMDAEKVGEWIRAGIERQREIRAKTLRALNATRPEV